MAAKWEWVEGGVKVGEKTFAFTKPNPAAALGLGEEIALSEEVLRDLLAARQAFKSGQARVYVGAAARLKDLIRECVIAEGELDRAARGIGTFFEPAGILAEINGDAATIQAFILEALKRLGERK